MKLNPQSEMPEERRMTWIAALWAALALLAAGAVLTGHHEAPLAPHAAAVVAAVPVSAEPAITPSDPDAPAASDRLAPTP